MRSSPPCLPPRCTIPRLPPLTRKNPATRRPPRQGESLPCDQATTVGLRVCASTCIVGDTPVHCCASFLCFPLFPHPRAGAPSGGNTHPARYNWWATADRWGSGIGTVGDDEEARAVRSPPDTPPPPPSCVRCRRPVRTPLWTPGLHSYPSSRALGNVLTRLVHTCSHTHCTRGPLGTPDPMHVSALIACSPLSLLCW